MGIRDSVQDKDAFDNPCIATPFHKSYKNTLQKTTAKVGGLLYYFFKKSSTTLMLFAVFSWFNIHNANFIQGIASLVTLDPAGFSLIFNYKSNVETLKEAWQVGVGTDYSWLRYKKETGYDLHGIFTYTGQKKSVMKDVVLLKNILDKSDCKYECDNPSTAVTVKEAQNICEEKYGARILNNSEYEKLIWSKNPVVGPKLNKRENMPEWTSDVNPDDGDDYKVYFKSIKKPKLYIEESYEQKGVYLDENADYALAIGFRCIIELPY